MCAEGTSKNSPAFQRWDRLAGDPVPKGRLTLDTADSAVPSGLGWFPHPNPALKRWAIFKSPSGTGFNEANLEFEPVANLCRYQYPPAKAPVKSAQLLDFQIAELDPVAFALQAEASFFLAAILKRASNGPVDPKSEG